MSERWVLAACSVMIAAASDFAGPESCRGCHPGEYASQSRSNHAHALRPILDTPLPALLTEQPLRERSGISFAYTTVERGILLSAAKGSRSASARLDWAFGAGAQAFTPVGTMGGRYFEHRISYYRAAPGARLTLGHPGAPSQDPESALGILQKPETIFRCFNCHSTGTQPGPDLRSMIPGVTCERCHGSAANHALRGAAMRPARLGRGGVMELCGSCHRLPAKTASRDPELEDPLSIRFAPVGLSASRCYRQSNSLTCVTCHNPHQNAIHDESYYTERCLGCHEQGKSCAAGQRTDCVRCHMQQRSPAPYLTFTDHRIRVYRKAPTPASSRQ